MTALGPDSSIAADAGGARSADWQQRIEGFRAQLLRLATRQVPPRLRGKIAPSDLVQLTLIKAGRAGSNRLSHDGNVLGWLQAILNNNLRDAQRRIVTHRRAVWREVPLSKLPHTDRKARNDTTPSAVIARREMGQALDRAIAILSPQHRRIIELRYRDRLTFVDIGQVLGISENAAQKLWTRAVDSLRCKLRDFE